MNKQTSLRAGVYLQQSQGVASFKAFVPAPLPPSPPLALDEELLTLNSEADRELGRLDGVAYLLPNPDWFVLMYARREAVLSSQIEGTQSTLDDLLLFEMEEAHPANWEDAQESYNYLVAMKFGLNRLKTLPMSLRLIREIHRKLMQGVRGEKKTPGEFRRMQNWIGPGGGGLGDAVFIPPPIPEMATALDNWQKFLHETGMPTLIGCALAHAQFETIHPFQDGNGRIGRLVITLQLCARNVLHYPLLYLSLYLKKNQTEYYERLQAVRDHGDWEGWVKFFLRGVIEVSKQAFETAREIQILRESHRKRMAKEAGGNSLLALDLMFEHPYFQVRDLQKALKCTHPTAAKLIRLLEKNQLVKEVTGNKRNRRYRYEPYLALFRD